MSTNMIDVIGEEEAKETLNDVCRLLNLGGKFRSKGEIVAAVAALRRRNDMLVTTLEYIAENGLYDGSEACAEVARYTLAHDPEPKVMLPMPDGWSKGLPAEQAKYWWNEDGAPILVSVLYSGASGTCFAAKGLHCWNRAQWVKDMGGYWKKAAIPAVPTTKEKNDGQR